MRLLCIIDEPMADLNLKKGLYIRENSPNPYHLRAIYLKIEHRWSILCG